MWSTREIAELAGTSLRAVRHYHEVGLLAEPERGANGYKRYGVAHLIRLLRIRRLTELGFSLSQIDAMGDAVDHPEEELRTLDAELAATIERLQRTRAEIGSILRRPAPTDLPAEFAEACAQVRMSEADRSYVVVLDRVMSEQSRQAYLDLLRDPPEPQTNKEFDDLPADADEATRKDLAERMAPYALDVRTRYPELGSLVDTSPHGPRQAGVTLAKALVDLYNLAQLDVLQRVDVLIRTETRNESGPDPAPE